MKDTITAINRCRRLNSLLGKSKFIWNNNLLSIFGEEAMKLTKLRFSKDVWNRLRFLAGRTRLTPNLLCRIGFFYLLRSRHC